MLALCAAALATIGVSSIDELFTDIPASVRFDRALDVPAALSEQELVAHLGELAARNTHTGELSFLGAPNCYLFTDLSVTAAVLLDPAGAASFPVPVPPALVGFLFYGQYAVLDPPANPFGFTASNAARIKIGL